MWDPDQYARFKAERAQPFHDVVARISDGPYAQIADLGCGTGALTRTLLDRWPDARIHGIDSSKEMIGKSKADSNVTFEQADLREWKPEAPLDLVVSNAVRQWVPDHRRVLEQMLSMIKPGGVFAVQIPRNQEETANRIIDEMLPGVDLGCRYIETPRWYFETLTALGAGVTLWETIYHHRLPGPDEVVEWRKETTLRRMAGDDAFFLRFTERVREAYPTGPGGVIFRF